MSKESLKNFVDNLDKGDNTEAQKNLKITIDLDNNYRLTINNNS